MTDQPPIKVLKKRGRKPKNKAVEVIIIKETSPESEKEIIITHLHININEFNNKLNTTNNDIFIKSESYYSEENENNIKSLTLSESENVSLSINNNFNFKKTRVIFMKI